MMLATSALASAAAAAVTSVFSPSRNPCVKRVAPSRFRYEPYGARVIGMPTPASESPSTYVSLYAQTETAAPLSAASSVSVAVGVAAAAAAAALKPRVASSSVRYAFVQFKHELVTFVAPFRIAVGDLVVVEGDRGENIGVVQRITQDTPSYDVTGKVLRRATDQDREALAAQREREANAMRMTQLMADSLGLNATIEDAEYQFDLNKLTIYVRRASKSTFVDFRKLQRGLFREFRCRIWCAYMDEVEAAAMAPQSR